MRSKRAQLVASACLLTLYAAGPRAVAQEKRPPAPAERAAESKPAAKSKPAAPADGTFKLLEFKINPGRVVKGAPYSATAVTLSVQTLADGNQIVQRREATHYRDGEGRVRIEQRLDAIGKWSAAGEPPQLITIFDPVAGHSYNLDPRRRTAVKAYLEATPRRPSKRERKSADSSGEASAEASWSSTTEQQGKTEKAESKLAVKPGEKHSKVDPASEPAEQPSKKKGEPLGKRMIEGVEAEGTRSKRTIRAGEIGNTLPIEITDESWYSPALQTPVMTVHSDPRSGVVTWRLTNIKRAEPERTLFEVPAGYTVIEKPASKIRAKRPERGNRPERPTRGDP